MEAAEHIQKYLDDEAARLDKKYEEDRAAILKMHD